MAMMALLAGTAADAASPAHEPEMLQVMGEQYPRAFFFRQAEGSAAQQSMSYERWERIYERLMGIEGKVLEEEVPGRSIRNIDFFTRFKKSHPQQLVLLHFNGNARDPRYESNRFFAGHWVYYNGARILSDVPAEEGQTDIRVDKPGLFKVDMGRYRDQSEDIGLCVLDAQGKPDWRQSEQVQLISVDTKNKTIRVRRGCYGTTPRAFQVGTGYAAAHVTEGPWGNKSHLLWYYNYSTLCPRDGKGRVCADVLVEHLAELFGPDGALAAFDGLEFDVLKWSCGGGLKVRGADCDADGQADAGIHEGLNLYGAGVIEFCRRLRERLGDERLILADGMGLGNQRAFGILNGIESEGWPHLSDHVIHDWSGGLNRHFFWDKNARPPVFNYINHKFNMPTGQPGVMKQADVPFSTHRLVFAVAAFTNSAICYSYAPANDADGLLGIWDEFRMGTENKLGWLGKPLGPPVRMAMRTPDLLGGGGAPIAADILQRFAGDAVQFELSQGALKVSSADPKASEIRFRLNAIRCRGADLLVSVTVRGDAMRGYPAEAARLMYVGACSSGGQAQDDNRFMTWVGGDAFDSSFYFSNIDSPEVDLEFTVEGSEPVSISSIRAYAHPDAICREFQNGLVLANPAPRPYGFDLAALFPGRTFRRLRGSPAQDAVCNDGSTVGGRLQLGPKEGLFLVRVN